MHDVEVDWDAVPLRRTPTQERSRDKVARALTAAEDIVRRDGLEAVTLPAVAAGAGVSVGALYQYLPDREAIAAALASRYHARLEALLDAAIDGIARAGTNGDPVGTVLRAVTEVYDEEAAARGLRTAGPDAAGRAHKDRMAAKVAELLRVAGVVTDQGRVAAVARVSFVAADAVLHDAFTAAPDERIRLLAELERMLRGFAAGT